MGAVGRGSGWVHARQHLLGPSLGCFGASFGEGGRAAQPCGAWALGARLALRRHIELLFVFLLRNVTIADNIV